MLHIQESISRFVCSATDAINSKKISRSEIENLKSQDLGRKGSLAPVYEAEEVEEPNSNTLASELGSSSLAFIKDMGFLKLAERLTGRFEEVKNSWQQREDKLKEETKQNKDLVKRLEEEISAQKEKIEKLSNAREEREKSQNDFEFLPKGSSWGNIQSDLRLEIFKRVLKMREESKDPSKSDYVDSIKGLCEDLSSTKCSSAEPDTLLSVVSAGSIIWGKFFFHASNALGFRPDTVKICEEQMNHFISLNKNSQKEHADFILDIINVRLSDPAEFSKNVELKFVGRAPCDTLDPTESELLL